MADASIGLLPAQLPADPVSGGGTAPPNAYEQSADWFNKVGEGFNRFEGGLLQNINDYINPYYEQVIGNTLGRMRDEQTKTLGRIGDQADAGDAFGGARHGLVESDTRAQFDRNMTEYTDRAHADAFGAAAGLYGQDFNQQMGMNQGMMGLGNTYMGIGNQIQQQQAGYGQMQQQLMQQLMNQSSGMWGDMTNSPNTIINMLNGMMSMDPRRGAGMTTGGSTPGLFDYLSLGMQAIPG